MPNSFKFDVFLSHSSKDKAIGRDIAERLKKDGVKVWFDEGVLKPGTKTAVQRPFTACWRRSTASFPSVA